MAYGNMTEGKGYVRTEGKILSFPMGTVKIYEGSCVFANSQGKAVFTPIEGSPFLGVSLETKDNTGNIGEKIRVFTEGCFEFTGTGFTGADLGKTVYLDLSADPNTVTTTKPSATGDLCIPIGKIMRALSGDKIYVKIDGFAMREDTVKI
ncbi:MAG: hypothetical protein KBT47_03130 [Armatimonadetes bacterium]|nr:hypothetical protein [Candidatus Hippobium faecium]